MNTTSHASETAAASESWAKAHPWLTTWIVLSAIAGVVQVVDILTGKRAALRMPRQALPFVPTQDAKASAARPPSPARPASTTT